jgi:hypothetical protein
MNVLAIHGNLDIITLLNWQVHHLCELYCNQVIFWVIIKEVTSSFVPIFLRFYCNSVFVAFSLCCMLSYHKFVVASTTGDKRE